MSASIGVCSVDSRGNGVAGWASLCNHLSAASAAVHGLAIAETAEIAASPRPLLLKSCRFRKISIDDGRSHVLVACA